MKKYLYIVVLSLAVFMSWASSSHSATYTVTQLTDNDYWDKDPKINDHGHVVWCYQTIFKWNLGHWEGDETTEIFLYDGSATIQLTDNDYEDSSPQINNNDQVVWCGNDGNDFEIFLYDGSTTIQLTDNDYGDSSPQINDNGQVVWSGYDGNDSEIFLYDGSATIQLTDNDYEDSSPQINDNGQIVWMSFGLLNANGDEIFLYDGLTVKQITDNDSIDMNPLINKNGQIVWEGRVNDSYNDEIFLYDGSTTIQLTDNDYSDRWPQINDNGQVVWVGESEIYLYDGSTTIQLTDNDYDDWSPRISNNNLVVWFMSLAPGSRIYVYDGSTITQIPHGDNYEPSLQINDEYIVWVDGDYYESIEIYYAVPLNTGNDSGGGETGGSGGSGDGGGGGCFIATAAFGSSIEPHVIILREFRDRFMLNNFIGKAFVRVYYKFSPPIADVIAKHPSLRFITRICLLPIIGLCWIALRINLAYGLAFVFLSGYVLIIFINIRRKRRKG